MRYLFVLVLCGCGGGFYKDGAQPGEWNRDLYACRKESAPAAGQQMVYNHMMTECLALRGWYER